MESIRPRFWTPQPKENEGFKLPEYGWTNTSIQMKETWVPISGVYLDVPES